MTEHNTKVDSIEQESSGFSSRQWKALAGIAAVLFGAGFSGMYTDSTVASIVFGLVAVAGGIYIMNQVTAAERGVVSE